MESLKSIVAYCLSPLVISLAVMLVGWLLLRFKKRRGGLIALGVATAMLWIGSLPVISHRPLRDLEYAHPPLEVASIGSQYATPVTVAVLGCGLNGDEQLPANSQASATFLSRFSEGVRVHKALSNS